MQQRLRRCSLKLAVAFAIALTGLWAQDLTNYLTPSVARVGMRLACRCGGCRMTVGNCPMVGCGYTDPMRRRIFDMQAKGMNDNAIVAAIVKEQGVIALAGQQPLSWIAWAMPPIVLLLGFGIWTAYVRRNRAQPAALTPADEALLERFHNQISRELGDGGEEQHR